MRQIGGPRGIRTLDLSDANRTLSQLSYEISITLNASFNQAEQLKSVSIYAGAEIFEEISEKGA